MRHYPKYILSALLSLYCFATGAQTVWPTPELEQMYNQAREYLSQGNLPEAINTYKQAIILAPDQMVLYRDLAKAYCLSGNYSEAENTITPVIKTNQADDQSYEIMAECQTATGEKKKARATLQNGLTAFPNSGILYHEMGKIYEEDGAMSDALRSWLNGIHQDPGYHINYYEATRIYINSDKPVWALIYGEIFVNIERHTPRSDEVRAMLLRAYTNIFNSISNNEIPKFGKAKKSEPTTNNFEETVRSTLLRLSPVISDGMTTENLTMLRARFLMEWFPKYATQYPFYLFTYQDNMIRNGYFEIYNEWLFGKAENAQTFDAWNKFHAGDIDKFESWAQTNKLQPTASEFYNDMNVDNIIKTKK